MHRKLCEPFSDNDFQPKHPAQAQEAKHGNTPVHLCLLCWSQSPAHTPSHARYAASQMNCSRPCKLWAYLAQLGCLPVGPTTEFT